MSFGLDASGLEIKRQADIKTELEESFRGKFGRGINLDARSPYGQIIGIISEREALVWELIEEVYNSQYPDTSEGTSLDNVSAITGTTRKGSTFSVGILTLIGDEGTVIPTGSVISVDGNEDARFVTDEDATILAGTDEVQTITFIQTPESGNWRLTFDGEETGDLNESSTSVAVKAALEALSGIDQVDVTGSVAAGFVVTFQGQNELSPQLSLSVTSNTLVDREEGTITTALGAIDGRYFIMQETAGSVAFWIDEDDSGTTIPGGAASADRAVEITTINSGDDADVRATKIAAALDADAAFDSASAIGPVVSWVAAATGALDDAADGNTGWAFATTVQGRSAGELTGNVAETTPGVFPQVDVGVTAESAGAVQAPAGSLSVIETPVSGWAEATNALDIEVGDEIETDQELKIRRLTEIAISGKATVPAVRSAISAVDGVSNVVVFYNKSAIEDAEGRPPHSLDIVVEGGDDQEIGDEIFDVVAGGIETIGDVSVVTVDDEGFSHTSKFSRPDEILIYLEIDLTVDAELFPADGEDQVEALAIAFGNEIGIGGDVIVYPQLLCSFADISGILDVEIRIATAPIPADGTDTVTASDDSGELLLTASSALTIVENNKVTFTSSGTLPTGIAAGVVYHVVSPVGLTFKIATERGGDPISFSDAGTGTHTVAFGGRDDNIEISSREVAKFDSSRTTVTVL